MDKLELDDRVSRLERRVSIHSVLFSLAGLGVLAAAFVTTARIVSAPYGEETATISTPVMPPPESPASHDFVVELQRAHKMQQQGLISQADLDQKREMILAGPIAFSDEVAALNSAKGLVNHGIISEADFDVLKRKVLKFGK